MLDYLKNKISMFVVFLCACAVVVAFAGSSAFAQESYAFVKAWGTYGTGDGQFNSPHSISYYAPQYVLVSDQNNNRYQKFSVNGTYRSKYGSSGSGNGQYNHPAGILCDISNYRIYVADKDNNRIQRLSTSGVFGKEWGSSGSGDGQFSHPVGIAKMPGIAGTYGYLIYVSDTGNNRIQIFHTDGTFEKAWGSAGTGNGQFNAPHGINMDKTGYVYVADYNNNRVQKFNPDGSFVTAWGSKGTGNGQFDGPYDIDIDANGNVYVTDSNNHRVQKFTANGGFIGAWGTYGTGDGQFKFPKGLCLERASETSVNVFVVDSGNNRIQKFLVTPGSGTTTTAQGSSTTTSIQGGTSTVPGSTTTIPGGTTTTISGGTTTIPGGTTTTVPGGTTTTIPGGTTTTISGGTTTILPGQVVADFTASPTEGYRQLTVSFTNLSQGDIVTYLWYFGDGQESGQKDPVHIYKKKGTYSVILKVFGRNDTQDSKAKDSYIIVKSRCIFIQSLDNSEAVDTLRLLRNILFNNSDGTYLASMYYRNAEEISAILEQNPALQEKFRDLVRGNLAVAEAWINAGEATVSAKELDAVITYLHEVQAKGSLMLQMDIDIIVMGIKRGYLLQGLGITVE